MSLSETYYFDPDDFAAATTPRPEGDGCDKDQLDNASGERNTSRIKKD